ncbi:hypothetical protein JOC94_004193 [Bacillus thermophilus]|uniref:Uncharacterized protein n=1 Tax=Siminovitchia thermophila TaxID=1245522 RepID=A0ABS2RBX8_9BACI|nr:hypothetical protein [Siminovitchia thermophila]MBM7717168.1 hypothetical protein [Siminovitchia thermophila]
MENVFVIQTDDKTFKKAISDFLSKHCQNNDVSVVVYEMDQDGADEVMKIIKENKC